MYRYERKPEGFAVLTMSTILLMMSLAYSLSAYRGVFYQIKVAKNEIQARQDHWQAEGGLECGFSFMVNNHESVIPNNLNTACQWLELQSLGESPSEPNVLQATSGSVKITKEIEFLIGGGGGVTNPRSPSLDIKWKQGSWNDQ